MLAVTVACLQQGCAARSQLVRQGWDRRQSAADLLELSSSSLEQLADLTAEAKITFSHGRGRRTVTASMVYAKPDLFRLDVRGPLFSRVLTALVHADSLTVLSAGQVFRDAVTGRLLAELTDFDVGPYDIRYALLGLVRPGRVGSSAGITYPRADRAVVTLADESGARRTVSVDLHRGFVSREKVLWDAGAHGWIRELEEYRQVETAEGVLYLPTRVTITQGDLAIELRYRSYAADTGVKPETLFAGIPRGLPSQQ